MIVFVNSFIRSVIKKISVVTFKYLMILNAKFSVAHELM